MSTPQCVIMRNTLPASGRTVKGPEQWFTGGDVYLDLAHTSKEDDPSKCTNCGIVTFTPGARTNWHYHEKGQLIKVEAGSGWVCDRGEKPQRIKAGDTVWCPPGVVHWHGADENSIMSHFIFAIGGTDWYEAVTEEEFAAGRDGQ